MFAGLAFVSAVLILQADGCGNDLEFYADQITAIELEKLSFYSQTRSPSLENCIENCYRREFCRSAVFDPATKFCHVSYFRGNNCGELVKNFKDPGLTLVSCIKCSQSKSSEQETSQELQHLIAENVDFRPLILGTLFEPKSSIEESEASIVSSEGSEDCFRVMEQRVLIGASYAVERGVTEMECLCMCANSWLAGTPQCKSAVFYSERDECVLNAQNHLNASHPLVTLADGDLVTYYDFVCARLELEIINYVEEQCKSVLWPVDDLFATTATSPIDEISDSCYDQLHGHLLIGSSMDVQTDMTLQQCKCECSQNEKCKSFMYYAREQHCVINDSDRIERPDLLRTDESNFEVTYFHNSCSKKAATQTEYVQANCQLI